MPHIHRTSFLTPSAVLLGVLVVLMSATFPRYVQAGNTSVSNVVSVSAGSESSYTSVTTIIDGVVVESIKQTGPGTVVSHVATNTVTTTVYARTDTDSAELLERIRAFTNLINLYVHLLTTTR